MRILVLGGDGYLGWPTALHFSARGHDVATVDNLVRRRYDTELGTSSLVPISDFDRRAATWEELSGRAIATYVGDLTEYEFVRRGDEGLPAGRHRPLRRATFCARTR